MGIQKIPVQGALVATYVNVPGQTGLNVLTGATVAPAANRVTISRFKLTVATGIVITSGRAVVTCASHLNTKLGQQVTFSGATGAGALLNDQTWTIDKITSSSVYEFPCNLPDNAGVTGTIVQEPVFTLPQGWSLCTMDANANVEMNNNNTNESPTGHAVAGVATAQPAGSWSVLLTGNATPVVGLVFSDGFATRFRCSGTTASSYFSYIG